jgi:hypothetical protein
MSNCWQRHWLALPHPHPRSCGCAQRRDRYTLRSPRIGIRAGCDGGDTRRGILVVEPPVSAIEGRRSGRRRGERHRRQRRNRDRRRVGGKKCRVADAANAGGRPRVCGGVSDYTSATASLVGLKGAVKSSGGGAGSLKVAAT